MYTPPRKIHTHHLTLSRLYGEQKRVYGSNQYKGSRESGVELLRIVAMFLVLVVHANFFSLGTPHYERWSTDGVLQTLVQSFAIVCVNVFVMISGWFGIRPKAKSLISFLFQIFFFFFGVYVVLIIAGLEPFSFRSLANCLLLLPENWFVKAYLLLYIISPVLNVYCESADLKVQRNLLILFFGFQIVYGWAVPGVDTFSGGYSTISFIGLYLLMQYVRNTDCFICKQPCVTNLVIFTIISLITTTLYVVGSWYHINQVSMLYCYNCPLVIIASLYFFLTFRSLKFKNRIINWIASSAFAVYLLHTFPLVLQNYFKPTIQSIFSSWNGLEAGLITFLLLFSIFVIAVLLDQIRKFLWQMISNYI